LKSGSFSIKYDEKKRLRKVCEYAGITRLDICNVLFQSIRGLKNIDEEDNKFIYPIPINNSYSTTVASLEEYFELKELSYIMR
jgi:hypothetical protein